MARARRTQAQPSPMAPTEVKVQPARGRPMLQWAGKRPITRVPAYPAQHIETFDPTVTLDGPGADPARWRDWPADYPRGGLLFHGDNEEVLAHLLANGFRGKVRLVYIDPPFDSGADYVRHVSLRGLTASRLEGESASLGEQVQYTDIWANDSYLQFMFERLLLIRELLAPDGSIYLHVDARRVHQLRFLLDEVFGEDAFRNQISWKRTAAHGGANRFGAVTDYLLFYARSPSQAVWHQLYQSVTQEHLERHYRHEDKRGRFALGELTAPGTRTGPSGEAWRGFAVRPIGRHWGRLPSELDRLDAEGLIYWPQTDGAWPRLKRYLEEHRGRPATDFWDDIDPMNMMASERTDYPTQKPEALIERVVLASSNPGDLVLDCFVGSGTTVAVAQSLGRQWIACDINRGAVQTTSKRLQSIISDQAQNPQLLRGEGDTSAPAQLSFTVWRVNDYDLQIQHNEAVNLASEMIGIEPLRSDSFFDGTLGKSLAKVVPFNHPLTPLDLEEVKRELEARPDEDRVITLVCLGTELAAQAWVDEWNRLRRGRNAVNRIEVIELRTDARYGGVIRHEPAKAKVKIRRARGRLHVEVEDFISPTIVQRLEQQAGVLKPQIEDWRAMVDSIAIDAAYDSEVFNIALADVPERKSDLVSGSYDLEAPEGDTTVAVKIIDMLGEEVLVTERV